MLSLPSPEAIEAQIASLYPEGMIVKIVTGANAGQMGQVVRFVHVGCVLVRLTRNNQVLAYGPTELR